MTTTTERNLTGKALTLVGRSEPPQEFVENTLWDFAFNDLDQFVLSLMTAQEVYKAHPDLVALPELPEYIHSIPSVVENDEDTPEEMAAARATVMAIPFLAKIVAESREKHLASPSYIKLIRDLWRESMREAGEA